MIRDADWLASAMYFLSGVMESGRDVARCAAPLAVMDRSLWSTLAVHYAHDPARLQRLLPLIESVADRLKIPDLIVVLEASPETCRSRIAKKTGEERAFDSASPDTEVFARREREFYHWLARQGLRLTFVDTDRCDPESVCRRAAELIRKSS
jgi:thymidylate kinase